MCQPATTIVTAVALAVHALLGSPCCCDHEHQHAPRHNASASLPHGYEHDRQDHAGHGAGLPQQPDHPCDGHCECPEFVFVGSAKVAAPSLESSPFFAMALVSASQDGVIADQPFWTATTQAQDRPPPLRAHLLYQVLLI